MAHAPLLPTHWATGWSLAAPGPGNPLVSCGVAKRGYTRSLSVLEPPTVFSGSQASCSGLSPSLLSRGAAGPTLMVPGAGGPPLCSAPASWLAWLTLSLPPSSRPELSLVPEKGTHQGEVTSTLSSQPVAGGGEGRGGVTGQKAGPVTLLLSYTAQELRLWSQSLPPVTSVGGWVQPGRWDRGLPGLLGPAGTLPLTASTAMPSSPTQPEGTAPRQARWALEWSVLTSPAFPGIGPSLWFFRIGP